MPKKLDPNRSAAKWKSRMENAGDDYKAGIMAYDGNPMQQAAAAKDLAVARYKARLDSGSWAATLNNTPKQTWVDGATQTGATRLVDGANKGSRKWLSYMMKAASRIDQIRAEIRSMPNVTDADRKARMNRNFDLMKTLRGIKGGS